MAKVIVLNQATLDTKYRLLEPAFRSTWASVKHSDFKVIHYYGMYDGTHNKTELFSKLPNEGESVLQDDGENLVVGTYDCTYPIDHPSFIKMHSSNIKYTLGNNTIVTNDSRGEKLILALEFCLNNFDFDFIHRICTTTYIDVYKMLSFLNKIQKTKIYNGARNLYNYEYYFVAGHCSLMSRDVVELLIKHKEEYLSLPYPEDLAIGKIIIHDLKYTDFESQNLGNNHFYTAVPLEEEIYYPTDESVYSYRIGQRPQVFHTIHKALGYI